MPIIENQFQPREYQEPLLRAIDNGFKKIFVMWHRRAGKDLVLWNAFLGRALSTKGLHYYFLPTYTQADKVIWQGMTNDGTKFTDYLPASAIHSKTAKPLRAELINGSVIELIGTDNYDAIRGTNPITCVFSEFAYQNPMAWETVKPILKMNGGVAIFNTTPNGKNHACDLWNIAVKSIEWYTQKLTIDDTGLMTREEFEKEIADGMDRDFALQEYYVSFDAGIKGNYYAEQLRNAEHRITSGLYNPALKVFTAWDIGYSDRTVIIFYQMLGNEVRIIDCHSGVGKTLAEYIGVINSKGYVYDTHFMPHDARQTRMDSGKSVQMQAMELGLNIEIVASLSVQDGINIVRQTFPRLWFENANCEELLLALGAYHKEYDEVRKVFKDSPYHDWSSDYADALRMLCVSLPKRAESEPTNYGFKFKLDNQSGYSKMIFK